MKYFIPIYLLLAVLVWIGYEQHGTRVNSDKSAVREWQSAWELAFIADKALEEIVLYARGDSLKAAMIAHKDVFLKARGLYRKQQKDQYREEQRMRAKYEEYFDGK